MVWTASGGILVGILKLLDGDEFVACLCENISIHSVELSDLSGVTCRWFTVQGEHLMNRLNYNCDNQDMM